MIKKEQNILSNISWKSVLAFLGILAIFSSTIIQWANAKSDIETLQSQYTQLDNDYTKYKEKMEEKFVDLLKEVTASTKGIKTMEQDIAEIKKDVKELLKKK